MDVTSVKTEICDNTCGPTVSSNYQNHETSFHNVNDNNSNTSDALVTKNDPLLIESPSIQSSHESTFIIGSEEDDNELSNLDNDDIAKSHIIHSVSNNPPCTDHEVFPDESTNAHILPKSRPKRFFASLLCCFGWGQRPETHLADGSEARYVPYRNGHTPQPHLLSPPLPSVANKICAVIDLDETLVHSSFKFVEDADFIVDVEIEGFKHQVYVLKRPFVDEFLEKMGELYECVLFTASLAKYADPVSDLLDENNTIFKYRLFREACVFHNENYVKDLARLGRAVDRCVIIDNSPASYMFNKENAIQVKSWFGDKEDTELKDLLPYFESLAAAESVSAFLHKQPPPCHAVNIDAFIHLHDPGH